MHNPLLFQVVVEFVSQTFGFQPVLEGKPRILMWVYFTLFCCNSIVGVIARRVLLLRIKRLQVDMHMSKLEGQDSIQSIQVKKYIPDSELKTRHMQSEHFRALKSTPDSNNEDMKDTQFQTTAVGTTDSPEAEKYPVSDHYYYPHNSQMENNNERVLFIPGQVHRCIVYVFSVASVFSTLEVVYRFHTEEI